MKRPIFDRIAEKGIWIFYADEGFGHSTHLKTESLEEVIWSVDVEVSYE